jgi:hypothetical protein
MSACLDGRISPPPALRGDGVGAVRRAGPEAIRIDTFLADSRGGFAGDGNGPIYVSLDPPAQASPPDVAYPEGGLVVDRLGSDNLAPLLVVDATGARQINPVLAANNIAVIKNTHGMTSHLSASHIESLSAYLRSRQK